MCTVVILRRPGDSWPLLLAANRDEMADRPWRAPARHWPDRPDVVAGLDILGGGTWLGVNGSGVTAAILNRINTLGPAPGRRSRGELPLLALQHDSASAAVEAFADLDPLSWRPFNMIVADAQTAFWVRGTDGSEGSAGDAAIRIEALPHGLSMLTAYDLNDLRSPRIRRYLPQFAQAAIPRPAADDWREWIALLASRDADPGSGPGGGMTVITTSGFGTVSSSLLALQEHKKMRGVVWSFAPGRPGESAFHPVLG